MVSNDESLRGMQIQSVEVEICGKKFNVRKFDMEDMMLVDDYGVIASQIAAYEEKYSPSGDDDETDEEFVEPERSLESLEKESTLKRKLIEKGTQIIQRGLGISYEQASNVSPDYHAELLNGIFKANDLNKLEDNLREQINSYGGNLAAMPPKLRKLAIRLKKHDEEKKQHDKHTE